MSHNRYLLKAALDKVGYKCTDSDTLDDIVNTFGSELDPKASAPKFLHQLYQLLYSPEFQDYMTYRHQYTMSNVPMPTIKLELLPELEPYDNQYDNNPELEQQFVEKYVSRIKPPRPY